MDKPEGQTPPSEVAVPTSDVQSSGEDREEENPSNTQKQREPSEVGKLGELDLLDSTVSRKLRTRGIRTGKIPVDPDLRDVVDALLTIGTEMMRMSPTVPENFRFEEVVRVGNQGCYVVLPGELANEIVDVDSTEDTIVLILDVNNPAGWEHVSISVPGMEVLFGSEFARRNNLGANNLVRFFRPRQPRHNREFVVDTFKVVLKKSLKEWETKHAQLHINREYATGFTEGESSSIVRSRTISLSDEDNKSSSIVRSRTISLSDEDNEEWEMQLTYYGTGGGSLKLTGNWKSYCQAHELKEGDAITIYRSTVGEKYLIRVEKAPAQVQ